MSKKKNYHIHKKYIHRVDVFTDGTIIRNSDSPLQNFIDTDEISSKFQLEVFNYATNLINPSENNKILDIGCGTGFKTLKYFKDFETVGLEIEPMITELKNKYPERTWIESNFAQIPNGTFSLIVCADVIEHIIDPDTLLDFIEQIDFKICVISTPDRASLKDRLKGLWSPKKMKMTPWAFNPFWDKNAGPPRNPTHVREWSFEEFYSYIGERFDVTDHILCKEMDYFSQLVCIRKFRD